MKFVYEVFPGVIATGGACQSAPRHMTATIVGRHPLTRDAEVVHLEGVPEDIISLCDQITAQARGLIAMNARPDPHAAIARLVDTARRAADEVRFAAPELAALLDAALAPWSVPPGDPPAWPSAQGES